MTEVEVIALSEGFADVIREAMTLTVNDVRERILTFEAAIQRDLGHLRERIAVVETREPVPGPPGPAGIDGKDGTPGPAGVDGKDGTPGLRYCGVFVEGKAYDLGDAVTWAGSLWHCNAETTTRPGESSKVWTLIVKRGRDGRDAAGVR